MAQIVIFAPPGEDVSAGEKALKDAGHDVEIVEATPANLLHMAIGMVENDDMSSDLETPAEAPAEEAPAEDEVPAEEEEVKEALGTCTVNGVMVEAFAGSHDRLVVTNLQLGKTVSYTLNESQFSFWPTAGGAVKVPMLTVKAGLKSVVAANVELAEGDQARLIVGSAALRTIFK